MHLESFPTNLFTRIGSRFVKRYYMSYVYSSWACGAVAIRSGQVCGYIAGVTDTANHRNVVRSQDGAGLLVTAAMGFAFRPVLAARFLRRRAILLAHGLKRRLRRSSAQQQLADTRQLAVLTHVAVQPLAREGGIGTALVNHFMEGARDAACEVACLATLDGPDGAGPFYENLGWELTGKQNTFDGRPIRLYEVPLGPSARESSDASSLDTRAMP